jgi:hypothetical protein
MRALAAALLAVSVAAPATAAVFAHAVAPNGRVINLHDGTCKDGSNKADMAEPDGAMLFTGCWLMHPGIQGAVWIKWDDGDETIAPVKVFKRGARQTL